LEGRRAVTHWSRCDLLAELFPTTEVDPDPIFVRDGHVWTSAGITAGMDLALALVEEDHGATIAHDTAAYLVMFTRRPGGQSQFSAAMRTPVSDRPGLRELQAWIADHLDEDLTVARLAERAGMSERHLARVFRSECGTTPADYVEDLRLEAAKQLLERSDLTVEAIARRVGLSGAAVLHRLFQRRLGVTPSTYRRHFRPALAH
jgi:transcriptional regulator GlxA family with amidase domain